MGTICLWLAKLNFLGNGYKRASHSERFFTTVLSEHPTNPIAIITICWENVHLFEGMNLIDSLRFTGAKAAYRVRD